MIIPKLIHNITSFGAKTDGSWHQSSEARLLLKRRFNILQGFTIARVCLC
jgi:hypothetical protein